MAKNSTRNRLSGGREGGNRELRDIANNRGDGTELARPLLHQHAREIQPFGKIAKLPIALDEKVCAESTDNLNQILADTITLRDMYKKHHWQVAGHTFYQLHLLFDKHYEEQNELVDSIAERIQSLGGVSLAMAHDVAETTIVPRPPRGREEVPVQISRLLEAHEIVLKEARTMAKQATEAGDDGTNDLLVSDIIRTNELQVWFISEHLVNVPVVKADPETASAQTTEATATEVEAKSGKSRAAGGSR
jgi:starvation-inducible DNA-binding protein